MSSPSPGFSTLTTSAPRSPSSCAALGPANILERSSTLIPESAIAISALTDDSLAIRAKLEVKVDAADDLKSWCEWRLGRVLRNGMSLIYGSMVSRSIEL